MSKPKKQKKRKTLTSYEKIQLLLHKQSQIPDADVVCYTDGACCPNPGPGGWSSVLLCRGRCKVLYGGERHTTNNRMEMKGAIMAMRALTRSVPMTIYTDSLYLQQGASVWVHSWIKNNKINERKNPDLWMEIYELQSKIPVTWKWVKGHNGDRYNEMADRYAVIGSQSQVECTAVWLK